MMKKILYHLKKFIHWLIHLACPKDYQKLVDLCQESSLDCSLVPDNQINLNIRRIDRFDTVYTITPEYPLSLSKLINAFGLKYSDYNYNEDDDTLYVYSHLSHLFLKSLIIEKVNQVRIKG